MYETPPPRRKSCEACKAAKRRCDLVYPCSRCAHKNLPCIYPGRQPAYTDLQEAQSLDWADTLCQPLQEPGTLDNNRNLCTINNDLSLFDRTEMQSSYDFDRILYPISLEIEAPPHLLIQIPRIRSNRTIPQIFASHLKFAVDVLEDAPRMMVLENQTPWCHPQLYKNYMPKDMQDAYACCSLYMSKNEINAPVITALLNSRAKDLLSTPEPTSLLELVARTQALIFYQIICLFDEDVRSQVTAERLFAALKSSVLSYLKILYLPRTQDLTKLLPPSMESIADFWNAWILQESARRTALFAFAFVRIDEILHGNIPGYCDGRLGLDHSWYMSAHLWNAPCAFDFSVAWVELSSALECAMPEDIDLFGRMILVTILGIEDAQKWFRARGAAL
ncbi:hypothetical protein N7495_005060 [Penicillium taxi]|uniref:uncharacterized protein n=1 Tax=Penicillium taxi TaxID=168475 RepID=UPI002545AFED|nr:uncharacterized protein N7495_005060 [Penicillium taxi]KAJ5893369.1 hypothetical protein N7495_005060 [Penicillium taxi]